MLGMSSDGPVAIARCYSFEIELSVHINFPDAMELAELRGSEYIHANFKNRGRLDVCTFPDAMELAELRRWNTSMLSL